MVYYYSTQTAFHENSENSSYKIIRSLEEIKDLLEKESVISIDCETTGLDPLHNKIVMFQFGTKTDQFVIDTRGIGHYFTRVFKPFLERKDVLFVGHNLKFDYNMLKQYGIVLENVYDTMLVDRIINNGRYTPVDIIRTKRYSLAGVYKHYFGKTIPKTVRDEFCWWKDKPFTIEQITYGAKDVIYPLEIREKQLFWVDKYELKKTVSLENKSVLAVGDIEYNGFYIDPEKWLHAAREHKKTFDKVLYELDEILVKHDPTYKIKAYQLNLFGEIKKDRLTHVNWESAVQVKTILKDVFKIKPINKEGKYSTETKALIRLVDQPPIIKKLIEFRAHAKVITSFGEDFLFEHMHDDQRIRSHFNQMVDTGRMSSRSPNMQQIPRGEEFRSAFVAPKGSYLITADYSNQEGRIMADHSKDQGYIDFFNKGQGDVHSFIAQTLFSAAAGKLVEVPPKPAKVETEADKEALDYFNKHPNKHLRQQGKVLNFMISFGGSAYTLAKDLKIEVEEAEKLIDAFYKGFPGLKKMFDSAKRFALKHGFIRTNSTTNRIRWIPEWDTYRKYRSKKYDDSTPQERSLKAKARGRVERKGMNTGIQGTAGDMTKTALILIRRKLQTYGFQPLYDAPIKIVQVVHDEIAMEAAAGYQELAAKILSESMEEAGTYFVKKVKMKAAPVIDRVWDH